MTEQEHRHFSRIPFDANITVSGTNSGQQWQARLIDISLKGVLLHKPDDWQAEQDKSFHLDLCLDGAESDVKLAMNASIAHVENDCIGFEYNDMDLDTATHLHRLIELNLGDEALLERELAELIDVKSA
jgi:hypothetical protein